MLLFSGYLAAVPAIPTPFKITQPDGTILTIRLHGDEFFNYETTTDGYLIKQNTQGYYQYAVASQVGGIELVSMMVNDEPARTKEELEFLRTQEPFPAIERSLLPSNGKFKSAGNDVPSIQRYPLKGKPKSLVILVEYQDVAFSTPNPQIAFTNLLNEEGYATNGGTGSARDYFRDNSMGEFDPEFVVVGPYTLPERRSYYGTNGAEGDVNPDQMIADACELAKNHGVDFSIFDTDNDGYVDNVFVYYAGHNEAEGGPKESIWPHRWGLYYIPTFYDGKIVLDYACTSELRGSSGKNMCGIGTFVHEFGHVLGLPDYYATNNASHPTLGNWNTMDSGSYNNYGRTPPFYSAYDRFYLKWLTPVELINPNSNVLLDTLSTSNQAYLLTKNGNHNLNGANPAPKEFIMLENRQNHNWDAYLPGHGLYVTHIVFNSSSWSYNSVNNSSSSMGYSLVRAGRSMGYASDSDPFPGSANITSYSPTLRSGEDIAKPIMNIEEVDGIINFSFISSHPITVVHDLQLFDILYSEKVSEAQEIQVKSKGLDSSIKMKFADASHFQMKLKDDSSAEWGNMLELKAIDGSVAETSILIRYAPTEASYENTHTDLLLVESETTKPIQIDVTGKSRREVYVTAPVARTATEINEDGFIANWEEVYDATGYYLTVMGIIDTPFSITEGFSKGLTPPEGWVINASETISTQGYYGKAAPAIVLAPGEYIEVNYYVLPTIEFSFLISSMNMQQSIKAEAWNEDEWVELETIAVGSLYKKTKKYEFPEESNYVKFRITNVSTESGAVAIDDVAITFSKTIIDVLNNKWVENTSYLVSGLSFENDYIYRVRASDKTLYDDGSVKYENITPYSNIIYVSLLSSAIKEHQAGNTLVEALEKNSSPINIYNSMGELVKVLPVGSGMSDIQSLFLPQNQLYIIQIEKAGFKIRF